MVPTILILPTIVFGLLGYYPHRLLEVESFSDIGLLGQHTCIAYHDDWGDRFCRDAGEMVEEDWFTASPPCIASDQARPTWLDVSILRSIDGAPRPFVITPFLSDRDLLSENLGDCDWLLPQIRTVGGADPQTGGYDPDRLYFGAYVMGPELALGSLLPPPGSVVAVDRAAFAAVIAQIEASAGWVRFTSAGSTWGQVALTCMVLVFEETPVSGTDARSLLALALWAHAGETASPYGPWLSAALGLPPGGPPPGPRLVSFRDGIEGLYPSDARIPTLTGGWGALKAAFAPTGGG